MKDVLVGNIAAGRMVFLACERFISDLEQGAERGIHFDQDKAADAILFFHKFLCLAEGENDGKPFILEGWQQFIVGSLFGWIETATGFRRFRTAYIEEGKGNGKSPMAAGIGLFMLIADGENAAEIYSAAVMKDQAKILFRDAEMMVDASPALRKLVAKHVNNLSVAKTNSYFRPISSEKRGLDGKRVHCSLIDELHEHPDATVTDKMRAGTKGRRQALIFEITNSGYDRQTVCFEHHEYSERVLEGILQNDTWFAYVCQLDACEKCRAQGKSQAQPDCRDCDSWLDEDVWIKANPNLGVSIQTKYIREQVTEAVAMPSKENIVKRLNFCLWTQADTRAIGAEAWRMCSGTGTAPTDPAELRTTWEHELLKLSCYGGMDLASIDDIAAFVLLFPAQRSLPIARVLPYFFCPQAKVEHRVVNDRVPFDMWARQGFIDVTPGNAIDYDFIRARIKALRAKYRILEIGYDPWNAQQLTTQLEGDGFTMVSHSQGMANMTDPTKQLVEKLVPGKEFAHAHNPVLAWMAANLVTRADAAGNLRPLKPDNPKSPQKIDGIVAFIMAIARAQSHPQVTSGIGKITII